MRNGISFRAKHADAVGTPSSEYELFRKNPSHMLFGSYDLGIVSENASWHFTPVIRHSLGQLRYWTVKMTGMSLIQGKRETEKPVASADAAEVDAEVEMTQFEGENMCASGCYAIVDTGTSGEQPLMSIGAF